MKKIFIFGIVALVVLGIFIFNLPNEINKTEVNQMEETTKNTLFQGPVPEGYDLEHFRETGITKKLEGFE